MIIGCGVVRTSGAHRALLSIMQSCRLPMVVDAESLHALASRPKAAQGRDVLLTPNAGEYQVLTGKLWPRSPKDRVDAAKSLAKRYRSTVIVKGAEDFISDGTRVRIDRVGSPYMTKGGYGDLLAGVAGALLARGRNPFDAASAAAFIIGRAGEFASRKWGEGTLASDLLQVLPAVISHELGRRRQTSF